MNSGALLESFTQYVYSTLLDLDGQDVLVSRDIVIKDIHGTKHEFDVYYEFRHLTESRLSIIFKVAIECKDLTRPVEKGDVLEFAGKLKHIHNISGVIVSSNGYQSGARAVAEVEGIMLLAKAELPSFPSLVARKLQKLCLPDERAVGEPFWILMEQGKDGKVTGAYHYVPSGKDVLFPLYLTKSLAEHYLALLPTLGGGHCVRGVSRQQLGFMLDITNNHLPEVSHFGIVFAPPTETGQCAMISMSHDDFREIYCRQ